MQGRLRKYILGEQHELKAPSHMLECIRVGHKMLLLSLPGVYYGDNAKSAIDDAGFVSASIYRIVGESLHL